MSLILTLAIGQKRHFYRLTIITNDSASKGAMNANISA